MAKYLREVVPLTELSGQTLRSYMTKAIGSKEPNRVQGRKMAVERLSGAKHTAQAAPKSDRPTSNPIKQFMYDRGKRKEAHEKADAARGKVNWGSVGAGALAGGPVGAAVMYSYEKHWKKPK